MKEVNFDQLNLEIKKSTIKNISITKALGYLTKPFDKKGVAQKCFERGYDNPNNKYYRMTVEDIMEAWNAKAKVSMEYGKKLDSYIGAFLSGSDENVELYNLCNDVDNDDRLKAHCHAFDEFYKRMTKSGDTYIVCREQPLFYKLNDNCSLQGRFDALAYNKRTKRLIVIDWKSNAEVETTIDKYTENLLGPANDIPAKSWWTYTMQTFFYRMCLEQPEYLEYMKKVVGDDIVGINTLVVNLPEHPYDNPKACMGKGEAYTVFGPAFEYDKDKMNKIFEFSIKIDDITSKKKEESKKVAKIEENNVEEDLF